MQRNTRSIFGRRRRSNKSKLRNGDHLKVSLKLNTDGSFTMTNKVTRRVVGVFLRNNSGEALGAGAGRIKHAIVALH
jgi:hypothetical protein